MGGARRPGGGSPPGARPRRPARAKAGQMSRFQHQRGSKVAAAAGVAELAAPTGRWLDARVELPAFGDGRRARRARWRRRGGRVATFGGLGYEICDIWSRLVGRARRTGGGSPHGRGRAGRPAPSPAKCRVFSANADLEPKPRGFKSRGGRRRGRVRCAQVGPRPRPPTRAAGRGRERRAVPGCVDRTPDHSAANRTSTGWGTHWPNFQVPGTSVTVADGPPGMRTVASPA